MNRIVAALLLAGSVALSAAASGFWLIDGVSTSTDTVAYGTGSDSAYRGDWGAGISNLAVSAVQANHTGDVDIIGELSVSGATRTGRLVTSGLYDEAGRSIPSIAVDSAVRYDAGKVWEEVEGLPRNVATWLSVAWSPKLRLFVAVSYTKAAYSSDGINWTIQDVPMSYASGITWAPELGLFVVVTDSSRGVGLSQDGINWFMAPVPPSGNYTAVTWSSQRRLFIAVGANRIATSEDGLIWSTTISNSLWADICWSPERGRFVASSSGIGPRIGISEDGVNWTYPTVPDNFFLSVEWSPELGLFVAGGSRGGSYSSIIVSSNGEQWTEVPSAPKDSWRSIRWSPEARCFVAVSGGGKAMRSTDGYNWSMYAVPVGNALNGVEWSPSLRLFLATGGVTVKSGITGDVSVGSLAVEGSISASGGLSAGGNVQLGTAYGTNTISGDTQIGNSERRLDINQNGMFIMDAVTEEVAFAVEQYAPSLWRVDLKGNPLTNAGPITATGDISATGTIFSAKDVVAGGASLTNALQRSGDTMAGALNMATNIVTGQRFGNDAGNDADGIGWFSAGRQAGKNAGGNYWHAFGNYAGLNATGLLWHASGYFAGVNARGDFWHASGYGAGNSAVFTNSAAFGSQAGFAARGSNRLYLDVYSSVPAYDPDGATNDAVFIDNGVVHLGRGTGAPGGAKGGTLRGDWDAEGNLTTESITLGGETRTQWEAQSENGPAFFFGNGDYLYADGTNLFYVAQDGVTNQVSLSGPWSP